MAGSQALTLMPLVSVFLFMPSPLNLSVSSLSKSAKEAQLSCLPYQGQGFQGPGRGTLQTIE